MKKLYTLLILCFTIFSFAQVTIFSENMGTVSGTTQIATHNTNNGFQNSGTLTYSSGDITNPADLRSTSGSTGYTNASGGANVFFSTGSGSVARGFAIEGINASTFTNLQLQFAYRKEQIPNLPDLVLDFWNGTEYVNVPFTFNEEASAAQGWYLSPLINLPAAAQINGLKLRWVRNTNGTTTRIDDVVLKGTATTPLLSTSPAAVAGLNYIFGSGPSAAQSFALSGNNLNGSNVTATLPASSSFEISSNAMGTYGSSVILSSYNGASTDIFVRLKSGLAVGPYNDVVTISGGGVANVNLNVSGSVNEQIFLIYEFTGDNLSATQFPNNSTASDLQISDTAIVFGTSQASTWTGSGVPYAQGQIWDATTAATAKYFFYTLEANSGYAIDLTNISFEWRSTAQGPSAITVEVNGVEVSTFDAAADVTSVFTAPLNIVNQNQVEVRIKGWLNGSRETVGSGQLRIDDIRLDGEVKVALSVNDFSSNKVNLYPNPVNSNQNVFIKDFEGNKLIEVFDYTGKKLISQNTADDFVNMTGLSSGVYLIKVSNEGIIKTSKLIVK